MKKAILILLIGAVVLPLIGGTAFAATEAQKAAAIENGLNYLASIQNPDGGFAPGYGTDYRLAATGSAVLAFEENGWKAGDDVVIGGTHYGDVVGEGLNYLFTQGASVVSIGMQTHGDPDSDGNGVGAKFYPGGANGRDTYVTGLALPAIVKSGTPDALVTVGPLSGRTDGTGAGGAWTHKDVVRNVVDYFAWGQNENGTARGGWRYYANSGDSDNSTAQWPAIGMLFAKELGVEAPAFVKSELDVWIKYIQNANGGAGYDSPGYLVNEAKTGALLVEMVLAGYPVNNVNLQKAIEYLESNWQRTAQATWDGNFGHPYAMWGVYKGLQATIGVTDGVGNPLDITTLHNPAFFGASGALDAGDVWNWWEDYCSWIVANQNGSGYWGGYSSWDWTLATPWFINILKATKIVQEPDPGTPVVPEPSSMLLLASGLGALALRRKKQAA